MKNDPNKKRSNTEGSNDDVRTDFADGEPSITESQKPADPKEKSSKKSKGTTVDESGRAGAKP